MTVYNVINRANLVGGQPELVGDVLSNLDAIAAVINGQLDAANLKPAAAIAFSQLLGYPNDITKVAVGNNTWGLPKSSAGSGDIEQVPRGDGTWGYPRSRALKVEAGNPLQTITGVTTEQDALAGVAQTIAAGLLGTLKSAKITMFGDLLQNTGAGHGFTPRLYYDTAVAAGQLVSFTSSANKSIWKGEFFVSALNSTVLQMLTGHTLASTSGPLMVPTANATGMTVGAIDSTLAKNVRVTLQPDNAGVTIRIYMYVIELIG